MSRRIKAALIDLSGTLHIGSTPIPSCVAALGRLRKANIPFRICSNTSKENTASLLARLRGMGFEIHEHEMFTSLRACRDLVRCKGVKRPYLLLSDSALAEFSCPPSDVDTPRDAEYDAVVIGLAPERFTYHHLNTAFRILSQERHSGPVPFIATHKSRYLQEKDGLSMGPGGFVSALEFASGNLRAEIVGKPEISFFRVVLESLRASGIGQHDWADVAIIGDDIESDLGGGAVDLGLRRVLVQTGKYREGDERKGVPPDEIHASFAEFVDSVI